jgi:hypothetical protein
MTTDELNKRNSDIALMLRWDSNKRQTEFYPPHQFGGIKDLDELMFHLDWNWLMDAVEFIESKGYESLLGGSEYYYPEKDMRYIQSFIKDDITIYHESKDKKQAVFTAVSDFAKQFNENKL